jgi:cell division septal protein FtsQ
MPIPPGELRRLRDEERRRAAVHRRIRRERFLKRFFWMLIGVLLLVSLFLAMPHISSWLMTLWAL